MDTYAQDKSNNLETDGGAEQEEEEAEKVALR